MASFGYSFAGLVRDFLRLAPVGHVIITTNPDNPNTYGYRGTWELIHPDNTLRATSNKSATNDLGKYGGYSNTPVVPLPAHTHTGNTNVAGNHTHRQRQGYSTAPGAYAERAQYALNYGASTEAAGNHSHSLHINSSGVSNPTIDTRGTYFAVLMWHRTA